MTTSLRSDFHAFWKLHPALLGGICFLLGGSLAFHFHWGIALCALLLLFVVKSPKIALLAICAFFAYAKLSYPTPMLSNTETHGTALFCIENLKVQPTPFNRMYLYKGLIKNFKSQNGEKARNIPCKIYLPLDKERARANSDYLITGTLQKTPTGFRFKPQRKIPWEKIPNTYSLAELRFQAKKAVMGYLKKHLNNPRCAAFLSTMTTGEIDERTLSMEFNRIGLQHILAISGFHFGLLALFLGFFLRLFLSLKKSAAILLIVLTAYFIFIGNSPSVLRAWTSLFFFLVGYLLNKRCSALNALGLGLICELLLDPMTLTTVAFQLSFLATSALLLLYGPFNRLLMNVLPERPIKTIASMKLVDQHGYLLSALLRKALALNLAVHAMTLPALLFIFHKFSVLSFAYNLFFPFFVGLSLLLLILSFCFPFIHPISNAYTSMLLEITAHPPSIMNYYIKAKNIPFALVLLCIVLLFILGVKRSRLKAIS